MYASKGVGGRVMEVLKVRFESTLAKVYYVRSNFVKQLVNICNAPWLFGYAAVVLWASSVVCHAALGDLLDCNRY